MGTVVRKKAKGTKKNRKHGRAKNRHQAHIRYRNEGRGKAHQIARLLCHLERYPGDLKSRHKLAELQSPHSGIGAA